MERQVSPSLEPCSPHTFKPMDRQVSPGSLEPPSPFTPGVHNLSCRYSAEVTGAMCDAVFLLLQMPETRVDLELGLDEVSCAWLRLRRAMRHLLHQPCFLPKTPAKMWASEDKPPSSKELEHVEMLLTWIAKRDTSLDDAFDTLVSASAKESMTIFCLRNGLGTMCSKEDGKRKGGSSLYPADIPPPDILHAAMGSLLRSHGGISKSVFVNLRKWLDSEKVINNLLLEQGCIDLLVADISGAKLQEIVSLSGRCPRESKTAIQLLNCIQMLVEMEPKASVQALLFDQKLGTIIDMVLRQGLTCMENRSVLRLWEICQDVLQAAVALGRPKTKDTGKHLVKRPSLTMPGDVELEKSSRAACANSSRSEAAPSEPGLARAQSEPVAEAPSRPERPAGKPGGKLVRRKNLLRRATAQAITLPDNVASDKESDAEPPHAVSAPKSPNKVSRTGNPRAKILARRSTIADVADLAMAAAKREDDDGPDRPWELECSAALWSIMPPQTMAFAVGIALHSISSRTLMSRILRTAWQLLDKGHAVECTLAGMGMSRLRMQMDVLADQFIRSLYLRGSTDSEELSEFFEKVKMTLARLKSVCEGNEHFSQVAVLYGVPFIAECICTFANSMVGVATLSESARDLMSVLKPQLVHLFKRRDCEHAEGS